MPQKLDGKCKLCRILPCSLVCSEKFCLNELVFKFVGVAPYNKKFRDITDWFYLALWIISIIYQALLLLCFFIYPDLTFIFFSHKILLPKLLSQASGTYLTAVGGYGIFNIINRFYVHERRSQDINAETEKRKRRNGHRFIRYWWFNFLIMFLATALFDYPGDLTVQDTTIKETSFWIAVGCSGIAIAYYKSHYLNKVIADKINNK